MKKERLIVLGAASALALGAAIAIAQDAVKQQPENNKVLLENASVRVIEVRLEPGATLKTHSHPDHVIYFLEGAKTTMTGADGKTADVEGKPGEARYVEAVTHSVENTGKTPVHAIVVELKQ